MRRGAFFFVFMRDIRCWYAMLDFESSGRWFNSNSRSLVRCAEASHE